MKNIDLKSFLIGFFMATTLLLAVGASKATQDVRIVGIDKSFTDWDAIIVETEQLSYSVGLTRGKEPCFEEIKKLKTKTKQL